MFEERHKIKCVNIPRDLNLVADEIPKIVDYEDYSAEEFFKEIKKERNMTPICDRFSDNYNLKIIVLIVTLFALVLGTS